MASGVEWLYFKLLNVLQVYCVAAKSAQQLNTARKLCGLASQWKFAHKSQESEEKCYNKWQSGAIKSVQKLSFICNRNNATIQLAQPTNPAPPIATVITTATTKDNVQYPPVYWCKGAGRSEMQPTKIHGIRGMPNELGNMATEST